MYYDDYLRELGNLTEHIVLLASRHWLAVRFQTVQKLCLDHKTENLTKGACHLPANGHLERYDETLFVRLHIYISDRQNKVGRVFLTADRHVQQESEQVNKVGLVPHFSIYTATIAIYLDATDKSTMRGI